MPSSGASLSPAGSHVVAPGSSQEHVTTVAEGTEKWRLAHVSQMGALRRAGGAARRVSSPARTHRRCAECRRERPLARAGSPAAGAAAPPHQPPAAAHLCGSTSANLYSTSTPAGSSSVEVQTSPSVHVMCAARARSQAPSCSASPTSTSDCPKLTCRRRGRCWGFETAQKGDALHACGGLPRTHALEAAPAAIERRLTGGRVGARRTGRLRCVLLPGLPGACMLAASAQAANGCARRRRWRARRREAAGQLVYNPQRCWGPARTLRASVKVTATVLALCATVTATPWALAL